MLIYWMVSTSLIYKFNCINNAALYIYIIPIDVDDIPFYAHVRTMTPKDGKKWNCPSPCQAIPGTRIKHSAIHKTF